MKIARFFFIPVLVLILLFTSSCKKDKQEAVFSCKIDGTAYSGIEDAYYYSSNGILVIRLNFSSTRFDLQADNCLGTFSYGSNFIIAQVRHGGDIYTTFFGGSGAITLLEYEDGVVSGTFHFTAEGLSSGYIDVTEGKFDHVKLLDQ
ncbi:MAG: hypothetical protein C0592_12150 [Marinilabiliales bacterium]|nr:MAG: hypothetical protein C0592_12150 [Marinilabiliales bacterium]